MQMLSPIPNQALTSLRQLADKMEKILLLALENYGNTFVEPKVELGARFGHLVCESYLLSFKLPLLACSDGLCHPAIVCSCSAVPGHLPGDASAVYGSYEPEAACRYAPLLAEYRF